MPFPRSLPINSGYRMINFLKCRKERLARRNWPSILKEIKGQDKLFRKSAMIICKNLIFAKTGHPCLITTLIDYEKRALTQPAFHNTTLKHFTGLWSESTPLLTQPAFHNTTLKLLFAFIFTKNIKPLTQPAFHNTTLKLSLYILI